MAFYQATFSIAGVNAVDGVLANLKTVASDRATLREIGIFIDVLPTTPPVFGLKRMLAVGTGAITLTAPMLADIADGTNAAGLETAWATTRPTVTGSSGRRAPVANTIGNGAVFDFTNRGIIVPISAGLCPVNLVASGATLGQFSGYVVWEE